MRSGIYILLFLISCFLPAQNETLFEEGNTFYNNGKYNEAIEKYEAILNSDQHSAEVYFNLGNAHYKLNHIAPSIYYYEMALPATEYGAVITLQSPKPSKPASWPMKIFTPSP